jgi:hypothetical protein
MELLNLPSCTIVHIVTSWLQVRDVAKLDSACCNHVQRPQFLKTLRAPEVVVDETGYTVTSMWRYTSWLKWRALRAVKSAAITFADLTTVPLGLLADFVASVGGSNVATVVFKGRFCDNVHSVLCMMSITCKSVRHFCSLECGALRGIDVLLRRCSASLQSIAICGSSLSLMTSKDMELPHVKMLKVVGDCRSDAVLQLLTCCGQLEQVILQHVELSEACTAALEARVAGLTRLDLEDTKGATGAMLARLGSHCHSLRRVSLTVPESTTGVVEVFAATHLHTVSLTGYVTVEAFRALAIHCGDRLRRICIDSTHGLQHPEEGFRVLAEHCTALEALCCYDYNNLEMDTKEFLQLIEAQKGLLSIDLVGLIISDYVLDTLATSCPLLKEILLSGAEGYTGDGLMYLIDGCPDLQRVHVFEEDTIISYTVRQLWARINPKVKFILHAEVQSCWPYGIEDYV